MQDAPTARGAAAGGDRARLDRGRRAPSGWERWIGERGRAIGIDRFGASAPGKVVARKLGISPEAVVEAVKAVRGA